MLIRYDSGQAGMTVLGDSRLFTKPSRRVKANESRIVRRRFHRRQESGDEKRGQIACLQFEVTMNDLTPDLLLVLLISLSLLAVSLKRTASLLTVMSFQ
jgi:hypothetical protein